MKTSTKSAEKTGREWLILIIGLPGITFLAGVVTIYIAFKYADEVVDKNVTRFGVEISKPADQ